jgi:outer membrane receptor protein involved in Fe transport
MRSTFGFRAGLVGGVSLLGLLATPAMAQTISENVADDTAGISEIVVTAQRTAQSLQDVPISVSAFTSEALKERQIFNTTNLIQSVPNVSFTKGNFTGSNLTIRGVGNTAVSSSADAGVGIHYNDMPVVNPRLFESELYDMERVEILRGPQGTLFGRNATAGVINFIAAKASTKDIAAFGEVSYGNYNSVRIQGMVNVPIGDTFAVRVAGYYLNRDGFTENLFNDTRIDGRNSYGVRGSVTWEPTDAFTVNAMVSYFNEDSDRSRIQKQLCTSDPTGILGCAPNGLTNQITNGNSTLASILTSQEFLRLNGFGAAAPGLAFGSLYNPNDNTFSNAIVPEDVRQVYTQFTPTYESNELVAMANVEYRWDNFTLTGIGGYVQSSVDSRVDYSLAVNNVQRTIATNAATLAGAFGAAGRAKADLIFPGGNQICISEANDTFVGIIGNQVRSCSNRQQQYDRSNDYNHQWSGELRIESTFDGPINFLLGGIYLNYNSSPNNYYVIATGLDYASLLLTGAAPAGLASPYFDNRVEDYSLESYAVFGEVYWDINDELKFTGGLRWSNDTKTAQDMLPQFLLTTPVPLGTQDAFDSIRFRTASISSSAVTGRALLQWTPTTSFSDATMIYASYSRGYKAGGINPGFVEGTIAGATTSFQPEYINAFEIGTKNQFLDGTLQANISLFYYDYSGLQVSRILARSSFNDNIDATVFGIEGEFIIQPVPALQFNMNFSYLKTTIGEASISDSRDPSAGRSDSVIIKDVTNAANCVVAPTASGTGAQANAFVNTVNALAFATAGLQGTTAIPGTNTTGAYSVCNTLATLTRNPDALGAGLGGAIRGATGVATGSLPFQFITNPNGSVNMLDGVPVNLEGNQLQNSPEFKVSVGGQYNFDLSEKLSGFARIDYNFTGNFYARIYNAVADRVDAFAQMDAQVQFNGPDNKYYIRFFMQNILDNNAVTGQYVTDASSGLFTNIFTLDPRTYGLAIGFNY